MLVGVGVTVEPSGRMWLFQRSEQVVLKLCWWPNIRGQRRKCKIQDLFSDMKCAFVKVIGCPSLQLHPLEGTGNPPALKHPRLLKNRQRQRVIVSGGIELKKWSGSDSRETARLESIVMGWVPWSGQCSGHRSDDPWELSFLLSGALPGPQKGLCTCSLRPRAPILSFPAVAYLLPFPALFMTSFTAFPLKDDYTPSSKWLIPRCLTCPAQVVFNEF